MSGHPPDDASPSHLNALAHYELGATPEFACQFDQRFSYCLYVPECARDRTQRARLQLLVAIHGTDRVNQRMRDLCAGFAETHRVMVLAPLFPAGIEDPVNLDNYKHIEYRGIRFDVVLQHMIQEVRARWAIEASRIFLTGFSGGAQFAHRYLFLHPEGVAAASICAPGSVTLIDPHRPWWVGTDSMEQRFGRRLALDELRRVPVQICIGDRDLDTWEITHSPATPHWMEGANDAGRTRVERADALKSNLEENGVPVQLELVPGVGHKLEPLLARALAFFGDQLRAHGYAP